MTAQDFHIHQEKRDECHARGIITFEGKIFAFVVDTDFSKPDKEKVCTIHGANLHLSGDIKEKEDKVVLLCNRIFQHYKIPKQALSLEHFNDIQVPKKKGWF